MNTQRVLLGLLVATLISSVLLLMAVPSIHAWEQANGYPYGKLCQLYGTCR